MFQAVVGDGVQLWTKQARALAPMRIHCRESPRRDRLEKPEMMGLPISPVQGDSQEPEVGHCNSAFYL